MSVLSTTPCGSGDLLEFQPPPPNTVDEALPCVYCRGDIAAGDFEFWTSARRLVSATCPHCQRRVTLAASTWRRWVGQSEAPSA